MHDEIAALVSLCMGIRLQAGGVTRRFEPGENPRGRPESSILRIDPVLLKPTGIRGAIIPQVLGDHHLQDALLLKSLPLLQPGAANALVRAARLYQDAVWIAESEPDLSWVMLVSAIETVSNYWNFSKGLPQEMLTETKAPLAKHLKTKGAKKKFIDFVLEFLPDPPSKRPQHGRVSWDKKDVEEYLNKIYHYRSLALHEGTPFPLPMCRPPEQLGKDETFLEKPDVLSSAVQSAIWVNEDLPMYLHTFEYIVRHSLLNYWKSMISSAGYETNRN
ncbi:hypothetical protein HYR54_01130 [Candidatus Acetothermia bacterium]|nr:hypothetical protein [Candidatus Acetothermia bacterium]